jgi:hypothetical protein
MRSTRLFTCDRSCHRCHQRTSAQGLLAASLLASALVFVAACVCSSVLRCVSFSALFAQQNSPTASQAATNKASGGIHLTGLDQHSITSQYAITGWDSDSGLPNNAVQGMVQDKQGYIWLGTFNGLVRFDGVQFTLLSALAKSSLTRMPQQHWLDSLPSTIKIKPVEIVFCDSKGRVWVSVQGLGLLCIHMLGSSLAPEYTLVGVNDGLASPIIWDIAEDTDGTLLCATRGGLDRVRTRTDHASEGVVIAHEATLGNDAPRQLPHYPHTVFLDSQRGIWAGGQRGSTAQWRVEPVREPVREPVQEPVPA